MPSRNRSLTGTGVIALVFVALIGVMWTTGWGPSLPNPFASDKNDIHHPALLADLRDISEYHAATGSFQQIVDLDDDARYLPDFLLGDHVTMLAVGSVDGVIDFSSLADDAIVVDGDAVVVTLPAPRLGDVVIDHEATQTIDRDRGLFDRIGSLFEENPGSEREVLVLAEKKIEAAAAESPLLDRARANTTSMLRALLGELGYDEVEIGFSDGRTAAESR